MHPDLRPIDPNAALTHGWKPLASLAALSKETLCQISAEEMSTALQHLPLCFARSDDGQYRFVVMLGLSSDENLALDPNGRWRLSYMPTQYRFYPFSASYTATEMTLSFDHASGLYTETPDSLPKAGRFFTDEGQPSPILTQVIEALRENGLALKQTALAVEALQRAGLLEAWALEEVCGDLVANPMQNLYRINQQALKELNADTLYELHQSGALALAYAQVYSMLRINSLKTLLEAKRALAKKAAAKNKGNASVDQLLGRKDDTLKFNF